LIRILDSGADDFHNLMATSLYKCGDRNCYEEPIGSFFFFYMKWPTIKQKTNVRWNIPSLVEIKVFLGIDSPAWASLHGQGCKNLLFPF